MGLSEEAAKFIQATPLARDILLQLTEEAHTYFIFQARNSTAELAHVRGGCFQTLFSKIQYTGEKAKQAWAVLESLKELGVLECKVDGTNSPYFYNVAGERFYEGVNHINRTPEIRQELRKHLI